VQASDRVGLLYDLAHAISHEQLDIRWAKALTANGIAIDTFLVVGPDGSAPTDHGALGHLSMGLRAVL
jgi:UTP:GlnB (protein PII) uridylyltransferase